MRQSVIKCIQMVYIDDTDPEFDTFLVNMLCEVWTHISVNLAL